MADMLKARNAIVELRKWEAGGELDDKAIEHITDLCNTFEWLDESRTGAIIRAEHAEKELADLKAAEAAEPADAQFEDLT